MEMRKGHEMNNFEKIKAMDIEEMAKTLVACINPYEDYADYEYFSAVLPDVYFDKNLCLKDTKQWLESESEE